MECDDLFQTLVDVATLILAGITVVGALGFAAYSIQSIFYELMTAYTNKTSLRGRRKN